MPGIIGLNTVGVDVRVLGGRRAVVALSTVYTAVADDVIDQIFVHCRHGGTPSSVNVAAYTFEVTIPVTRIHEPVNIPINNAVAQWLSSATGLGIALTPGLQYCVARGEAVGCSESYEVITDGCSKNYDDPTLPVTWTHGAFNSETACIYAVVIAGGGSYQNPGNNAAFLNSLMNP